MSYSDLPIPATAGVGLKPQHYQDIFETRPSIGWFEIHPENYFAKGGANHRNLEKIRQDYPLSMHGVGLSLGSADGLDMNHLSRLKDLIDIYQPGQFSEHLSWSRYQQYYSNDLLPIPYTEQAMERFVNNVQVTQDFLERTILIENPSSYFLLKEQDFTEWEFLVTLCETTRSKILLDINNLYVSSVNHGFNTSEYLEAIPADLVGEIHLAGHAEEQHDFGTLLIDDHGSSVTEAVWRLYEESLQMLGPKPTLIEWDTNIPGWTELYDEANKAQRILNHSSQTTVEAS